MGFGLEHELEDMAVLSTKIEAHLTFWNELKAARIKNDVKFMVKSLLHGSSTLERIEEKEKGISYKFAISTCIEYSWREPLEKVLAKKGISTELREEISKALRKIKRNIANYSKPRQQLSRLKA